MRSQGWRRHWRFVAAYAAVVTLIVSLAGVARVRQFNSSQDADIKEFVTEDVRGTADLFELSGIHSVQIRWKDKAYERMLKAYFADGSKEFVEVDAVIDGTLIERVGIRLKGNATLRSLTGPNGESASGFGFPGGGGGFPVPLDGGDGGDIVANQGNPLGGLLPDAEGAAVGEGLTVAERTGPTARSGGFAPFGTALSTESPESLPWLISFDEFVKGRRYQGHRTIALRPAQSVAAETVLNEAVGLAMIRAAGEPAALFTYATVTVNDGPAALRLLVEQPDAGFAAREFDAPGALYKSLSTGRFSYVGENPLDYTESFRQDTAAKSADLQPLISFIQWANESSDEEFVAGLADRLDVASFARYIALHNLLLDFDDMSGPGQNYYLWFDRSAKRFTVVSWDLNIAMRGDSSQGPFDSGGFFGRPGGGGVGAPGGFGVGGPAGGAPLGGHVLKERFLANDAFKGLYEQAYRDLYQLLFVDGAGVNELDRVAAVLAEVPSDVLAAETVASNVAEVRSFLTERRGGLANDPVITAG